MSDAKEEVCIICKGKGYFQTFDPAQNKWVTDENAACSACKGKGIRKFVQIVDPYAFVSKIMYID